MLTIGILGGMSWESTVPYYRTVNQLVQERLGDWHSAKVALVSVDFAEIAALQHAGDWDAAGAQLGRAAQQLEAAGADFIVLATNTMHRVADAIEAAVGIPLLHIADATGTALRAAGLERVGLLGTRFTMEQPFYRERLTRAHGVEVLVPDEEERALVHRVIYDELVLGDVRAASREAYLALIERLVARGAQGIVLGCTEIGLLVEQRHTPHPLFDTTTLHARAAAERALAT